MRADPGSRLTSSIMHPASRHPSTARLASVLALCGVCASASFAAEAPAVVTQGTASAPPCAQCHGANGEGQRGSGFPRLAGQVESYLAKQLDDFRSGRRSNPIMEPIAKALDAPAVSAVSRYYAGLPAPTDGGATGNAPAAGEGAAARLAHKGKWSENVPACFACHGRSGAGIPPHFPAIAGQPRQYTAKQIRDWKTGTRGNDALGLMKAVSSRLSDAEIEALSAYLEQLR